MTATMTIRRTAARGSHSLASGAVHDVLEPEADAAARRLQHEQRAAGPDERHGQRDDDVRHARHDDQAAVDRAEDEPRAGARRSRRRSPNSSLWPFISEAAMTLVSAIIEPTDRSIPPEITTMACATAARASGRAEMARPWTPVGAVGRLDQLREHEQDREQAQQAQRPRVAATRAGTKRRRARAPVAPMVGAVAASSVVRRLAPSARARVEHAPHARLRPATASAAISSGIERVGSEVIRSPQERRLVRVRHLDLGRPPSRRR